MGVRFANAFGAHVVLFTTSANKTSDALRLGAHEVVLSKDAAEMQKHFASFDFILDTVSAEHDLNTYICSGRFYSSTVSINEPNQNINGSPRRWWPGGLELQIHWRMKAHNTRQLKL